MSRSLAFVTSAQYLPTYNYASATASLKISGGPAIGDVATISFGQYSVGTTSIMGGPVGPAQSSLLLRLYNLFPYNSYTATYSTLTAIFTVSAPPNTGSSYNGTVFSAELTRAGGSSLTFTYSNSFQWGSTSIFATLSVTHSYIRLRGDSTDTMTLSGLTSSTVQTMAITSSLGSTTTTGNGSGYTSISLGTSSTGPLDSGYYNLSVSLDRRNITGPTYVLTI